MSGLKANAMHRILVRGFSTSRFVGASDTYAPRPHARHFPVKTNTMLPPETFKDRVVLVTGGGTGLGKGMSTKFAELGAKVRILILFDFLFKTMIFYERLLFAAEE